MLNRDFFTEGQISALDLFDLPPTQTGIENIKMENIQPTSTISNESPILFNISGTNGMEYLDLMRSQMYVRLRVKHKDGTNLEPDEEVAPVNLFLQSLFSQIDVSIQGKVMSSTSGFYPYKAYIQTLLRYGSDARQSQLHTQLWLKDTAGYFDDVDFTNGDNTNAIVRMAYIAQSKVLDLQGPILHDFFQINRYLINQVGISVKFHRTKPEFCLLSNTSKDYIIDFEQMILRVAKVQVNPAVITAHNTMLGITSAKYPYSKCEIASMTLSKGTLNFSWNNIFQDVCPNKIVIGFVCSEATSSGSLTKNPWNFQKYDLSQISLSVDGISLNGGPMQLSYNRNNGYTITPVLTGLLEATKTWLNNEGIDLSREDIAGGFALYAFDTQPDFAGNEHLSLQKRGNIRIDVSFNTALPHTANCIVLAERQGYFEISQSRDVTFEW